MFQPKTSVQYPLWVPLPHWHHSLFDVPSPWHSTCLFASPLLLGINPCSLFCAQFHWGAGVNIPIKLEFLNFWKEVLVFLNEILWFLSRFWRSFQFFRHFIIKIKNYRILKRDVLWLSAKLSCCQIAQKQLKPSSFTEDQLSVWDEKVIKAAAAFDCKGHVIYHQPWPISYLHAKFGQNWTINTNVNFKGCFGLWL